MKKLNNISHIGLIIFIIGFVFQYLHFPGGGVLMLLSIAYYVAMLVVKSIKLRGSELYKETLIIHSATLLSLTYVAFRYMFFGFTKMIFPLLLLALILVAVVLFSRKYKHLLDWLVLATFVGLMAWFTQLRAYQIYAFKMQDILTTQVAEDELIGNKVWSASVHTRYAFYLNAAKKYDEAIEALDQAIVILEMCENNSEFEFYSRNHNGLRIEKIMGYRKDVDNREWKNFP